MPGGARSVQTLRGLGDAIHFVNEVFKHWKAIAATGEGVDLLLASGIASAAADGRAGNDGLPSDDPALIAARQSNEANGVAARFIQAIAQHRNFDRQRKELVPA